MFTAHRSFRPLAACLLASAAIAIAAAAPAVAADPQVQRAQATEQYLQSFGTPATQAQVERAEAAEQYLQSYGAPEPLAPSVPTSETPWLPIVLAVSFVAIGLGAVQARRIRTRRQTAVRLAT